MFKKTTRGIQSLLKKCDLFSVSQFIKYKQDSEFSTASGGFCSVTILTIFAVLFTSMAIKTVNRDLITWSSQITKEADPSLTSFNITTSNQFLFTAGIMYLNINDPKIRYFDFALNEITWSNYRVIRNKTIALVPCTEDHFGATPALRKTFHKISANQWVCPPIGLQISLSGKFTSEQARVLDLTVLKCDPSLDPLRPCANDTLMQSLEKQIGQFLLTQFYINPLLNPGNRNFIDYYIEDTNFAAFTSKLGVYSFAYVQDYTVITDQSILPFTVPKEQSGVIISTPFQNIYYEVTSNILGRITFQKSATSATYNRSYYKLDAFFSYVGGLVGVIMGMMIFFKAYNQNAFQLSLAKDLVDRNQSKIFQRFNMFTYLISFLRHPFKKIIDKCCKSQALDQMEQAKDEMCKQLDISLILSKLIFLQRSIKIIFEKGQFEVMHLNKKPNFDMLRNLRRFYKVQRVLSKSDRIDVPTLQNSEVDMKKTPNHDQIQVFRQNLNEESDQQNSSDQQYKQMKKDFQKNVREFQQSVNARNRISLQISQGVDKGKFYMSHNKVKKVRQGKSEGGQFEFSENLQPVLIQKRPQHEQKDFDKGVNSSFEFLNI